MKRIALIGVLSLASLLYGAEWDARNFTKGSFNGRGWATFTRPEKLLFTQAYYGGWQMSELLLTTVTCRGDQRCIDYVDSNSKFLPDVDMSDVISGVDEIYSHSENRSIIIIHAIVAFSMKTAGVESQAVDEFLRVARLKANAK